MTIFPASEAAAGLNKLTHTSLFKSSMDQEEVSDEDQDQDREDPLDQEDLKAGEQDEAAVAVEEIEMGQAVDIGDTFASPVNSDLSDNSETEGNETDFYIDDSEPADLEGLMVVFDEEETLLQYKHKDHGDDLLESEKNNNELDFNFEEEDSELEFNYEPGISLASLATCACPCLHHHETGHCQQ